MQIKWRYKHSLQTRNQHRQGTAGLQQPSECWFSKQLIKPLGLTNQLLLYKFTHFNVWCDPWSSWSGRTLHWLHTKGNDHTRDRATSCNRACLCCLLQPCGQRWPSRHRWCFAELDPLPRWYQTWIRPILLREPILKKKDHKPYIHPASVSLMAHTYIGLHVFPGYQTRSVQK